MATPSASSLKSKPEPSDSSRSRSKRRKVQASEFSAAQSRSGFSVDAVQIAVRILARRQAHHQFVDVEGRQHRLAGKPGSGIQRLGRHQLRKLSALHGVQTDVLKRLQSGAQHLLLRPLHPARHQAQASVMFGQHFDQQAGLAPGASVQDVGGFGVDAHQRAL